MAYSKIKGITVEISGDTTKLGKALESVNKQSGDLQRELNSVNKLLKFDPSNVNLLKQKQDILTESIKSTEEKLKKLKEAQKSVQEQFEKGEIGVDQYREFQREVAATEQKLVKLKTQMKEFGSVTQQVLETAGNKVSDVGNKVTEYGKKLKAASAMASAGLIASAKTAIDFESAFAGVEKTVDGTANQFNELKQGIRDMAKELPSSTTEIASVAEAAGQLGIKVDDILEFTKVMIDLGNSTNLSADEAASSLAKFANIMNTSSNDYSRLGAAIVDLGNNFATTEADIVSMSMRIAGAGKTIGLSEANVLSLATALSSVGIEAEMGGSAISKAMIKMSVAVEQNNDQLKEFAKVAGMSTREFKECFEKDAMSAISKFIIGLGDTEKAGKSTLAMLADLGFDEVRLRDTMLRAANASEVFNDAINTGNKAWEENKALVNEANKRYNTTASKMTISINKIKDMGITLGTKLFPKIEKILSIVDKVTDKFDKLDDKTQDFIITAGTLTALSSPVLIAGGKTIDGIGKMISGIGKLAGSLTPTTAAITATVAVLGALALALKKSKELTNESAIETENLIKKHKELDKTLSDNQTNRQQTIKDIEDEGNNVDVLYGRLVNLENIENKTNGQKELMAQIVEKLNSLLPDLNLEYDKETDSLNKTTSAIKDQIAAQKELIKAKAAESQLSDIAKDIVEQELAIAEATEQRKKIQEEYNEALKKRDEYAEKLKAWNATLADDDNYRKAVKNVEDLKKALTDNSNSLDDQRKRLSDLNDEYARTEKYAQNAFSQAEIKKQIGEITALAEKGGIEIPESLVKGIEEGKYAVPASIEKLNDLITFDEAIETAKKSGFAIPNEVVSAINASETDVKKANQKLNRWIDFEEALKESNIVGNEIPENIRDGVLNGKLSVIDAVSQTNDAINGKLSEVIGKVASIASQAGSEFASKLSSKKSETEQAGIDLITGAEEGVKNKKAQSNVFKAIGDFGINVLNKLKNALKENSPSKATFEMGEFLDEGVKKGVESNQKSVLNKVADFGKNVLNSLKEELSDEVALNANFNGTRNLMMNTLTNSNPNVSANLAASDAQKVYEILDKYMPEIIKKMGYPIVLNGKKVSEEIAPDVNRQLGIIAAKEKRGY